MTRRAPVPAEEERAIALRKRKDLGRVGLREIDEFPQDLSIVRFPLRLPALLIGVDPLPHEYGFVLLILPRDGCA